MAEENASGWSSFNYGEGESILGSVRTGKPEVKTQIASALALAAPKTPAPAPSTLDDNSQYKIAKKKELLNKKLNQLKTNGDGEQTQQVLIDQVQEIVD